VGERVKVKQRSIVSGPRALRNGVETEIDIETLRQEASQPASEKARATRE
jgi:hypothetical protein